MRDAFSTTPIFNKYSRLLRGKAGKGQFVDHINGNGLDCRRSNIRICSHAENMRNRKTAKSNKIGVKGVYLSRGRYRAEIESKGVRYRIGTFDSIELAGKAYDEAAERLHQEFARTNQAI